MAGLIALPWLVPVLLAWLLPAPLYLRLLLISLVTIPAWRSLNMAALFRHPLAPVRLQHHQQQLCVILRNGTRQPVSVGNSSRVSGGMLWLTLADRQRRYRLLLSARGGFANTEAAGLRRLTVWLRLSPETEHSAQPITGGQHDR